MPKRTIPGGNPPIEYYLAAFDEHGRERQEPDGGLASDALTQRVREGSVTDVIVMSHGFLGDVPAAIEQYDRWMGNLMADQASLAERAAARPGFSPLLVGIHWPSLPWGDEGLEGAFGLDDIVEESATTQARLLGLGAEALPDLRTIFEGAADSGPMQDDMRQSYLRLSHMLALDGGGAVPEDGLANFDLDAVAQLAGENDDSFGLGFGKLLMPLRAMAFWKMKNRARMIGEGGAHEFLKKLCVAAHGRDVRFHVMGHSFGCIVVTGMVAGAPGANGVCPVDSMMLVQGALSLWAYQPNGYYQHLIEGGGCRGPIVTTRSPYDLCVGKLYPLAAGIAGQSTFDLELPKYGGIGTWGIQGLDAITIDRPMGSAAEVYGFEAGRIYNLEASAVISGGVLHSDAHSDITHPEVARAMWQAQIEV